VCVWGGHLLGLSSRCPRAPLYQAPMCSIRCLRHHRPQHPTTLDHPAVEGPILGWAALTLRAQTHTHTPACTQVQGPGSRCKLTHTHTCVHAGAGVGRQQRPRAAAAAARATELADVALCCPCKGGEGNMAERRGQQQRGWVQRAGC